MSTFTAIIFDMDGVLIDSEPLHRRAWEILFAELGLPHEHGMEFGNYVGVSDHVFLERLRAKFHLRQSHAELHARKLHHLDGLIREYRPIDPELRTLVPALARRYTLAVATSSNQSVIDVVLEVAGLTSYFKATVGGDAVQQHKPNPEVYLAAARKIAHPPATCCAIEDSAVGIQAAKSAGMSAIGLTTSLTPAQLHQADFIAHNFIDVRQLLL
jgi:HAD superfamily hydrolase (TIGR01509 family)